MAASTPEITPEVAPAGTPWPRPRQAWYAVAIFASALTVNFLDRGILNLLVELKNGLNKTILMVTHDPRAAARAERVLHLEKGRLVRDTSPLHGATHPSGAPQ